MNENKKKREIRDKALAMFRENGYDNVTVNEIAAAAGISKNTFYYYYRSKEDLIRDIFHPSAYNGEQLMMKLMEIRDPKEQIIMLCRTMASYYESLGKEVVRKAMILNLAQDLVDSPREHKPGGNHALLHRMIDNIYHQAIEEKKIRTDLDEHELARLQMTLLIGCLQVWATIPRNLHLEEMYLQMVKEVLLPEHPAV